MSRLLAALLVGLASVALAAAAMAAAPSGRPVQTETIIVPPDSNGGMPDIPADTPDAVNPDMPGSDTETPAVESCQPSMVS